MPSSPGWRKLTCQAGAIPKGVAMQSLKRILTRNWTRHKLEIEYSNSAASWTVGFSVQFGNGPHAVASFFRKVTYLFKILIGGMSNSSLTVKILLHTGAGQNVINKDFLPPALKHIVKSILSPQLQTASRKVVHIEGTMPLLICMSNQGVRNLLGIDETLAVDVLLWVSSIDRCKCAIHPTEQRVIRWHSRPGSTLLTNRWLTRLTPKLLY